MSSAPLPSYVAVPSNPSTFSQDSLDDVLSVGPYQPITAQARLSNDKV